MMGGLAPRLPPHGMVWMVLGIPNPPPVGLWGCDASLGSSEREPHREPREKDRGRRKQGENPKIRYNNIEEISKRKSTSIEKAKGNTMKKNVGATVLA